MNPYSIYVSHTWAAEDGMERLAALVESYRLHTEGFAYEYYSVSKDDPAQFLPSNKALQLSIEEKLKNCSVIVILAGVYEDTKRFVNLELECAKKYKIPIILVEAGAPIHTTHKEKRAATEIIKWDATELGEAIVKHAKQPKKR